MNRGYRVALDSINVHHFVLHVYMCAACSDFGLCNGKKMRKTISLWDGYEITSQALETEIHVHVHVSSTWAVHVTVHCITVFTNWWIWPHSSEVVISGLGFLSTVQCKLHFFEHSVHSNQWEYLHVQHSSTCNVYEVILIFLSWGVFCHAVVLKKINT